MPLEVTVPCQGSRREQHFPRNLYQKRKKKGGGATNPRINSLCAQICDPQPARVPRSPAGARPAAAAAGLRPVGSADPTYLVRRGGRVFPHYVGRARVRGGETPAGLGICSSVLGIRLTPLAEEPPDHSLSLGAGAATPVWPRGEKSPGHWGWGSGWETPGTGCSECGFQQQANL